ncbi:hypothetical protein HYV86_00475 [Candidatus Woesearchaeota archaeon]|nr:hypothetical protein [Candidatus Woesearchaeota archaeon]
MSLADQFSMFQQNINAATAFVGQRLRVFPTLPNPEKAGYIVFGVGFLVFFVGLILSIL